MRAVHVAGLDGALVPVSTGPLGEGLDGAVVQPGGPGWDEAVRLWNGMVTKVPAPSTRSGGSPTSGRVAGCGTSTAPPDAVRGGDGGEGVRHADLGPGG